jgi:hypothetical protein
MKIIQVVLREALHPSAAFVKNEADKRHRRTR